MSVSQLTNLIKLCLEGTFGTVAVEGEISNYRPSSTGHLYFTLKDSGATIQAVMFKNRLRSLTFAPRDGMFVRAVGSLSVYPQRGSFQIICESLDQAGEGELLSMLEERKRRLAAEGLFDLDRKKPLPRFPRTVAVISSPTGAALRDILNILSRRAAGINVVVLPAPVQGSEAAHILARRIEQANVWKLAEVIILGRGGGSLEDLLPFSDETVVRAVASSEIPVISAVGHEIDWALSDFAADLRAPTPSAAAELVSGSRVEALDRVRKTAELIYRTLRSRLDRVRLLAKPFAPEDLEFRFRTILQPRLVRFDDAKEALLDALRDRVEMGRRRHALALTTLEAANPLAILERGYSMVTLVSSGSVLRKASDVRPGDRVVIRPRLGRLGAIIEESSSVEE